MLKDATKLRTEDLNNKGLFMSVEGLDDTGKTSFALSAPGPLCFFDFDFGLDEVVRDFIGSKDIYRVPMSVPLKQPKDENILKECTEIFDSKFYNNFVDSLTDKDFKTIVVDTASDLWEIVRYVTFGRLEKVLSRDYGPANRQYKQILMRARISNKNVILLHRQKKDYQNDRWMGKYSLAGFGETRYSTPVALETSRSKESGKFKMTVLGNTMNMNLCGYEFFDEDINFPTVASVLTSRDEEEFK